MFPIEVDLSVVRRQRETGMKGLGQVLKSFRDREVDFSVYDQTSGVDSYLHSLGALEMQQQGSRAGLHVDVSNSETETQTDSKNASAPGTLPFPGHVSNG